MTSKEIKNKILGFFRFEKRYFYIATEVKIGRFKGDVVVDNRKEIIEIEVKVSKSDLLQDLDKQKHLIYKKPSSYYARLIPNKFYFAVPKKLVEDACKIAEKLGYGVLEVGTQKSTKKNNWVKVIIKAKALHDKYNTKLHHKIALRNGSEFISNRRKL